MISIIMPVYNAEKYLRETIISVLRQSYRDYELICIDDASCDSTARILRHFQSQDNRIKIIYNERHVGAAASRNLGIMKASGTYITFLDGDDIFDEDMLLLANWTMEKKEVDIVMYEYKHVRSECIYIKKAVPRSPQFVEKFCRSPFAVRECSPIEFMNWSSSPWNKLYRRSFIVTNHLGFQSLDSCNDVFFVVMALILAEKIIMLEDRRVMVYARDHDGTSRISNDRDPMCIYWAMKKIGEELIARGMFCDFYEYYYCFLFYNLQTAILRTKREENAKQFYNFLRETGIRNLLFWDTGYFNKVDIYFHNLFEQFYKKDFYSEWYKKETILAFYLNQKSEEVKALVQTYIDSNKRIALWGAGKNGRIFLDFLHKYSLEIEEVVDCDERKQGQTLCGYKVKKPEIILDSIQIIFVTAYAVYCQVMERVSDKNVEVIDIGAFVGKD